MTMTGRGTSVWRWMLVFATLYSVRCISDMNTTNEAIASSSLNELLNNTDYRIRPQVYGPPVLVTCDFFIAGLGEINEVDMDFLLDIYFRMEWQDNRLVYGDVAGPVVLASHKDPNVIWTPDLYFPNEKQASFHYVTRPNRRLSIYRNGTVKYSTRLTLTLTCPMILTYFPMDNQECYLKITSYSYSKNDLVLKWAENTPIETPDDKLTLPQFLVQEYTPDTCNERYKTGEFSCLKARFKMKRQFGFFMLRTYIPSILIVILSWIAFWIHKEAVPARITLGVTTVLTMTTQLGTSRSGNVRVSYPKAIDVWYAFCMILVFAALIEYALVNIMARRESEREEKEKKRKEGDIELQPVETDRRPKRKALFTYYGRHLTADGIDKVARIAFPAAFVLFNFLYWVVYLQPNVFPQEF